MNIVASVGQFLSDFMMLCCWWNFFFFSFFLVKFCSLTSGGNGAGGAANRWSAWEAATGTRYLCTITLRTITFPAFAFKKKIYIFVQMMCVHLAGLLHLLPSSPTCIF